MLMGRRNCPFFLNGAVLRDSPLIENFIAAVSLADMRNLRTVEDLMIAPANVDVVIAIAVYTS